MIRSLHCVIVATLLALAFTAATTQAAECERAPVTDRPKIGLVLGGGGARGAAHIGVIKLLEELHVPVDFVAGTSMGSLVGAFYATGMNAAQLEQTVTAIDFDTLFRDATARQDEPYLRKLDDELGLFGPKLGIGPDSQLLPSGAVHGQKISFLFEQLISDRTLQTNFDDLPIPYRAVATDIITGNEVVLDSGSLAVAMRASMSVPGAFDPVPVGEYLLVDGGLANNVPIDVVRRMGADIVIAVDVGTPLARRDSLKTLLDITAQLSGLLVVRNSQAQIAMLTDRDVLIAPALGSDIGSASFDRVGQAIPIGYQGAGEVRAQLEDLAIGAGDYAEQRRFIESCVRKLTPVQFVRLDNRSRFEDAVILKRLHVPLGEPLDTGALEKSIEQIYALGYLALVRYEIADEDGKSGVIVHVSQDSRGTRFLEWGVDLFSGDSGTSANLRLGLLDTGIDDLGSEARVMVQVGESPAFLAEMSKAVNPALQLYLRPQFFAQQERIETFDGDGHQLYEYDVDQFGGQLDVLRQFSTHSAISAGVRLFSGDAQVQVGDRATPDYSYNGGEYVFNASWDSWDDSYFPTRGTRALITYIKSSRSLNSDAAFEQVISRAFGVWSSGRHTVIAGIKYDITLDDDAPIYGLFRGGGLFNLSALQPNQITGQNFGMVISTYRFNLSGKGGLFPAYVGVSAEYGNAGEHHQDPFDNGIMNASLYFGNRSPVGPLYWGIAFAEDDERAYFLRIGNVFGKSSIGR